MENCKIQGQWGKNQWPHRRGTPLNPMQQIWRVAIASAFLCLSLNAISFAQTTPESKSDFRKIEQPLLLKIGVTFGGLGLIAADVWWFLLSKPKAEKAQVSGEVQEIEIIVDGGYQPNRIVVDAGQPVRLNFFRKDPSPCVEQVIFPDFHKSIDLSLNQITTVELTPEKPGKYSFHCGMNMVRGELEVE